MSDYTQEAYECSIQTSAVRIDNTEWINEFSGGIKLKKGDQVRLLGSFIQEGSNSNEIEVEEEQEINISYSPYILGNTIDTIDKTENGNLMDLSQIGDIPYSTDSFGIEPPMRNTTQKGNSKFTYSQNVTMDLVPVENTYPTVDGPVKAFAANAGFPSIEAYDNVPTTNPAATGESGGDIYGDQFFNAFMINGVSEPMASPVYTGGTDFLTKRPNMIGDKAVTWGTNLPTGDFQKEGGNETYERFSNNTIPTEMYIGNMIKKFILPIIDRFETANSNVDPTGEDAISPDGPAPPEQGQNWATQCVAHTLEPLVRDHAAAGQAGMFQGVPKVGQCIATVDIGESSGWYTDEAIGHFENTWGDDTAAGAPVPDFVKGSPIYNAPLTTHNQSAPTPFKFAGPSGYTGIPNLKSGVQSVIGTIVAVRPIKMHIMGITTDCYEIYATNFINPAQLLGKAEITHTFTDPRHLTRADSFNNLAAGSPVTCKKMIHGAGLLRNGYSFNPSFNNINGGDNHTTPQQIIGTDDRAQVGNGSNLGGQQAGMNSGVPTRNSYLNNAPTDSTIPAVITALQLQSGPANVASVNTGAGRTGASQEEMGLGNPQGLSFLWNGTHTGSRKISNLTSNVNRYRANSWMEPNRNALGGATTDKLRVRHYINDIILEKRVDGNISPGGGADNYRGFNCKATQLGQGSVPVCLGAYVICPKETMIRLARGEFNSTPTNNFYAQPTFTPRIWLDYAYQTRMSSYTTRHNVGNSFSTFSSGDDSTDNPATRFPQNSTYVDEHRWGYSMLGRPPNINWRSSRPNLGLTDLRLTNVMNHDFTGLGYSVDWDLNAGNTSPNGIGLPNIFSSDTGAFGGGTPTSTYARNLPIVYCGYNTCCNSIYFQQKDTGDTKLGIGSWRGQTDVTTVANAGATSINVSTNISDIITGETRVPEIFNNSLGKYSIKILVDNCQYNPVELVGSIVNNGNNTLTINLLQQAPYSTPAFLTQIPFGSIIIINYLSHGGVGAGTTAEPWASDLIMIKENIMKLKIDAGFYTEEQLAEKINDTLHFTQNKYQAELGTKDPNSINYNIPSNVGITDNAFCSEPSLVRGNFVQSYIPDINYGFTPITVDNAAAMDKPAQTKELTGELLTYETLTLPLPQIGFEYYWPEQISILRPYNGNTTRYLTDNTLIYPTELGKHMKIYSIPFIPSSYQDTQEITLLRLRGGGLTLTDFDTTSGRWNNVKPKMPGVIEPLRCYDMTPFDTGGDGPQPNPYYFSTCFSYGYRSRLTRNLFSSGGSARIFCGANNFTFSWEQGANRYSFNNFYTPVRPHEIETKSGNPQDDFGIGDAIPSAIIASKHTGNTISQLTGIYVNRLNAGSFTEEEWGQTPLGDYRLYDTRTNDAQRVLGQNLLTILGFTSNQVDKFNNNFDIVKDLFVFESDTINSGSALRIGPKLTPAINASNPTSSRCLNVAPVQQFFVQVDTDDFFAVNVPSKGNDPYYKIGSDFPCKTFFGNQNGAKIPIIGLCSRNFSAFNFVFDLGGSAINYMITENTTISSIRTKIYTSQLRSPVNLSENSAVVYLITRYGVKNDLTPQEGEAFAQQFQAQANAPMINDFYSQPTADIRTMPPINPNKNYFTGFGQIEPEEDSSDED